MSPPPTENMEQILDRFDEAWNGPTPPRIEDYLAASHSDRRLSLLIELIRIDLERRLAAGEKVRLEEAYLRRFPELSADPSAVVTLVKHEFELRRRNEPELTPAEYLERFPQCQTELLAQLPTLEERRDGVRQQEMAETVSAPTELDLRSYELMEALGKGGMGEVYRCGDPALGRDLAIKIMKADLQKIPEVEHRFLREARVTASLQHPGIVAVHNLGRLSDGRLHYTMRLVRGRTFADILNEDAGQPQRLPSLLAIFEKVCEAVAYAHSKRVIHRDLKPTNIMVGKFGEVQVMDWGLAKLLHAQGQPGEEGRQVEAAGTLIYTEAADTPSDLTQAGAGVGTPAYMSPEQAQGEWNLVDERADVFALGAILCVILTGDQPYRGENGNEILRRAKRGDLPDALARLETCGADEMLTALCRECLAPEREDRPRDAAQVAQRVAAHQAEVQELLRRAELERTAAVVKAQGERQRRRWILAASFFLLAGIVGATWQALRAMNAESLSKENESRALEAAQAELSAKRQAEQAAQSERKAKELAQNRLGHIEKVNEVLTAIFRDLDTRSYGNEGRSLRQQLSQRLERAAVQLDKASDGDPVGVARLLTTLGGSLRHLDQPELALKILPKALKTLEDKLGPDDPDTLMARHNLYSAYLYVGRQDEAIPMLELNFKLRKSMLGPHHPDTLLSGNNLASAYSFAGRINDSIRLNEQILKEQENHLGVDHPHTFKTRNNLAAGYMRTGRSADAIRLLEPSLEKLEAKLGDDYELIVGYRNWLASAYQQSGRTGDAIRLYEQNLKVAEANFGPDDRDTLTAVGQLAWSYCDAKQGEKAVPLFAKYFERLRKHTKPDDLDFAGQLAKAVQKLLTCERYKEAESYIRECLTIREKTQPDAWTTFNSRSALGAALLGQKKCTEAEPLLLQGYEGMKAREAKIPPQGKVRLTEALERLVQLYEATNKKDEAAKWRKKLEELNAVKKKTKPSD